MKTLLRSVIVSLAFMFIVGGCSMVNTYYGYSVHVKNIGSRDFDDVEIESQQGFWFRSGYLIKDSHAAIASPQSAPPNDIFLFVIKEEGGSEIKRTIDMRDKVERSFRGELYFIIDDNNNIKIELQKE